MSQNTVPYVNLRLNRAGFARLFCGRVADVERSGGKRYYASIAVSHLLRFMVFMGKLFVRTNYFGMVDIGIAVTGIKGLTISGDYRRVFIPYLEDSYRRTERTSVSALIGTPGEHARSLFMPLMDEMSRGLDNPFTDP